jgi:hypothetical protein
MRPVRQKCDQLKGHCENYLIKNKIIIHGLITAQKSARIQKCQLVLAWYDGDEIIFSDEKLYLLQETPN